MVAETIQAEAGIILPVPGFLEKLRKKCSEQGALLVIDDVQMGFGRTGKLFSFEHFNILPDILVLAKAMGGGMPIGAFISSKKIMDQLSFNPELGHITTFGGHPLSCAAALANLDVLLKDDLIGQAEKKGKILSYLMEGHPMIKEIRGKGLVYGIEIKDGSLRKRLTETTLDNGILIDWFLFNANTFRVAPPLTITEDECRVAGELLLKSMNEI